MSYVDYAYYTGTYLGTLIASADFAALALRASAIIDQQTFDRAAAVVTAGTDTATIDKIKMATCALAEELQKISAAGDAVGIQSESVGNHSVTYAKGSGATWTAEQRLNNVARLYLGNTGLMFRGFAEGE